jgi:lipopolysaccharide/colanic/teichoic acid biosynthesis glycosyltransferase
LTTVEAVIKRALDLLISVAGTLLLLPLLTGLALIILLLDGGPIVYSERRIGYRRRPFTLYKFRTLNVSTQYCSVATAEDSRLTKTGGFLRRWHLDELLQLANILIGEMSLVGPRPMKREHADTLPENTLGILLSVKPGLTGPASIKFLAEDDALAGYPNAEALYLGYVLPAKVECQINYIRNFSLYLDLKLILQTLRDVLSPRAHADSIKRIRSLLPVGSKNSYVQRY